MTPPAPAPRHSALLWGLADPRLDLVLTAATVLAVALSRFTLLASGPWEWDETLFARGMLDFDLAGHFPHPPGFPGLLALGHLLLPLAGEPIVALQWLSALASVLLLWPLALLGRRVATPAVATAAALLVLFLPGPWLFSARGFSTIPATAFALAAAAVLAGGLAGRRTTAFTLLVTAAFLVRPILLPAFAALWLAGAVTVRPWRRLLPGLGLGVAAVVVATLVMVHLQGGWAAFVAPFDTHGRFHAARLHLNSSDPTQLGMVTGAGGSVVALLLLATVVVGLAVWARRAGWRAAAAWGLVLAVLVAQLLWLQNRTYPRYAVAVHLASAPLLAAAAALAPVPVAVTGLLGLTAASAWRALPFLREQHDQPFAAWQVAVDAERLARERGWAVVVEPEVHPFASYRWHVQEAAGVATPPLLLSPRAPEQWLGIDRPWLVATVHPHLYPPSLSGRETAYRRVSAALEPLTQRRFLAATLLENAPLPVGTWWSRETAPDGSWFMWGGAQAELWLPPAPVGSAVLLDLRPASGDSALTIRVGQRSTTRPGHGERALTRLVRVDPAPDHPTVVAFARQRGYAPGGADERELAFQLFGVELLPPGPGLVVAVFDPDARRRAGLDLTGAYPEESFGAAGRACWLEPSAQLALDLAAAGAVDLTLLAPRPTDPMVTISTPTASFPVKVASGPTRVSIPVTAADLGPDGVVLTVTSRPYCPADAGASDDRRRLGVVLVDLSFTPSTPASGPSWWGDAQPRP